MDKKAQLGMDRIIPALFIILIFMFGFMMIIIIFDDIRGEKDANKLCEELDLELFDYELRSLFRNEKITCWDPDTKEVTKIK